MLNYVWLTLIILGIGVALTTDIIDKTENKYRNGKQLPVEIIFEDSLDELADQKYDVNVRIRKSDFNTFYDLNIDSEVNQKMSITFDSEKNKNVLFFKVNENSPELWKKMAKMSGKEDDLMGSVLIGEKVNNNTTFSAVLTLEDIAFAKMKDVTNSALDYASIAVNIALGLIGIMALWLGVMKVAEDAGLIKTIANAMKPLTKFLFPEVPQDHPAMGAMIMNMAANMLGLGNAATPFGLKAMEELDKLNPNKGVATNAMITFLAVNTAGLTLIPVTAIAIRAAAGSSDPAIIIGTSIFGAICATTVGITVVKLFEKNPLRNGFAEFIRTGKKGILIFVGIIAVVLTLLFSGILSSIMQTLSFINPELFKSVIQIISTLAIPMLILIFIGYGAIKKVKIYEVFVEGAKEGFDVAIRIIPYLVAMLVAIGIFRAGGGMEILIYALTPFTNFIGMPAEALPMALMRPLSGSGSLGIMAEIIATHGPDSFIGILVSTFFGSTETTFYVLAVYFGSVNIRKTRHALVAGLLADIAGILGAVFIVKLLFG